MAADGGIDVAGGCAGLQGGLARVQGPDASLEQLALAGRRPAADGERVGEVAAVARDDHREVEQQQVARARSRGTSAGRLSRVSHRGPDAKSP